MASSIRLYIDDKNYLWNFALSFLYLKTTKKVTQKKFEFIMLWNCDLKWKYKKKKKKYWERMKQNEIEN